MWHVGDSKVRVDLPARGGDAVGHQTITALARSRLASPDREIVLVLASVCCLLDPHAEGGLNSIFFANVSEHVFH